MHPRRQHMTHRLRPRHLALASLLDTTLPAGVALPVDQSGLAALERRRCRPTARLLKLSPFQDSQLLLRAPSRSLLLLPPGFLAVRNSWR
eukprot:179699-Rhodomonas_salina.4